MLSAPVLALSSIFAGDLKLPSRLNETLAWSADITTAVCESEAHIDGRVKARDMTYGRESLLAIINAGNSPHNPVTFLNHQCYAATHGIKHYFLRHNFLEGAAYPGHWNKPFAIKAGLMRAPMGSWVVWMDIDSLILNPEKKPDTFLHELLHAACHTAHHSTHLQCSPGDCHVMSQAGLNNGVLAFRKSCWTMRFLDAWWALRASCSARPLFDNGPFILAVHEAMHGHINTSQAYAAPRYGCAPAELPRPSTPEGVCILDGRRSHRKGRLNIAPPIGPGSLSLGCQEGGGGCWEPGDWGAHFPGSSRINHPPARNCFRDFMNATLPILPKDASNLTLHLVRCRTLQSMATIEASRVPNCTSYTYPIHHG
jgi:hypothetical protein